MADATNDTNLIRKRMAEIRMELHEDVQGVVAGTEAAFDWQYYVRLYPWGALAAAVVAGYLVVPRKRRVHVELTHEESGPRPAGKSPREEIQEDKKEARRKSGMLGMAFGFLSPIVMRAAQNYASQYVENWIQQQTQTYPPGTVDDAGMTPGPGISPGPPLGGPGFG